MRRLDEHDRAALAEAAALVQDVLDRHPFEAQGPILTSFNMTIWGIENVRRYLESEVST